MGEKNHYDITRLYNYVITKLNKIFIKLSSSFIIYPHFYVIRITHRPREIRSKTYLSTRQKNDSRPRWVLFNLAPNLWDINIFCVV